MRVGIGARLTWDDEQFIVIAIDYRHAVLRSLTADFTRHVEVEELIRMPEVTWHLDEPHGADPSAGQILDALPPEARRVVDAWAEQLARVKAAVEAGEAAKYSLRRGACRDGAVGGGRVRRDGATQVPQVLRRGHLGPGRSPVSEQGQVEHRSAYRGGVERARRERQDPVVGNGQPDRG
ncbi:hypothetical protein JM654_07680 [Microbacterium oxydans]|nr:hypothetical protein [Microbacterium oxydans]